MVWVSAEQARLAQAEYERLKHAFEHIFGPDHSRYGELGRDIEPSNAFIGIYLRLECLLERGLYEKAIGEIRGFFGGMADLTGTLWEHDNIEGGSLNHGFASYCAVWLVYMLTGYRGMRDGVAVLDSRTLGVDCEIALPIGDRYLTVTVKDKKRSITGDVPYLVE